MAQIVIPITGMSCMGCVNSVKNLLSALAGVNEVEVDLAGGWARVDYDADWVGPAVMREVIESGGFQAPV